MFLKLLCWLNHLTLAIFSLLWLTSYHYHHSIGFDHEQIIGTQVQFTYERLLWPGNGALLIGQGQTLKPLQPNRHYDAFDVAASFFHEKYKLPEAKAIWNRLGFWWVNEPQQYWIGLPAWLPVLLGLIISIELVRLAFIKKHT